MQSIIFAAALLSAVVNGAVLRRTDDCDSPALICGANSTISYTVVSGDTLTTIAQRYNSGICDIASLSGISDPNSIYPDEVLTVPVGCTTPDNTSCLPGPAGPCVPGVGSTYNVRSGDNLSAIAAKFNITLAAIEGANPQIQDFNLIYPGEIINIPICPDSKCDSIGTYQIKSGDTFFALTATYGTSVGQLEALNENVNETMLAVGQVIVLAERCKNVTSA